LTFLLAPEQGERVPSPVLRASTEESGPFAIYGQKPILWTLRAGLHSVRHVCGSLRSRASNSNDNSRGAEFLVRPRPRRSCGRRGCFYVPKNRCQFKGRSPLALFLLQSAARCAVPFRNLPAQFSSDIRPMLLREI
jgi:hypothetical protein